MTALWLPTNWRHSSPLCSCETDLQVAAVKTANRYLQEVSFKGLHAFGPSAWCTSGFGVAQTPLKLSHYYYYLWLPGHNE